MYPIMQEVSKLSELATSNPQAIMQKYAQDPQVKYLLALNEAKRLKEAMQRNQAIQSPTQPTVMQSLEQQSGLASLAAPPSQGEMAEDVGGVLQFQAKKQQENLQRMAQQGLPAAPGAGTAMTPQAMAAGGIVAFSDGGGVYKGRANRAQIAQMSLAELQKYNRDGEIPTRLRDLETPAASSVGGVEAPPEVVSPPSPTPPDVTPPLGGDDAGRMLDMQMAQARTARPPVSTTDTTPQAQPPAGATPQAQTPPELTFPTLGEATTSREPTEFEKKAQASLQQSMAQNPLSMAEQVANSIQGRMDYTPDERKPLQQQRAGLEALLAERRASDRERQLSAFLRSAAGGRTFGETLGRASSGAAAAEEQAYRERLKGVEDLGKLGMADVELGRTGRVEGAKQIGPMAKAGIEALSSAQRSATDLSGTLSREGLGFAQLDQRNKEFAAELESKGYDRQNAMAIAMLREQSQRDLTKATREATSEAQLARLIGDAQYREGREIAEHRRVFERKIQNLRSGIVPGSPGERQAQADIQRAESDLAIAIADTKRTYARLRAQIGRTGGATVTPVGSED